MWLIGFLLCFITVSRQLSISEFNVPDAVSVGDNASLQCRYELDPNESDKALFVKWWWTPLNTSSDERTQLYQRIAGRDPVAIHHEIKIEENDDILLLNVSVKDSGTYECEVSNIEELRMSDQLIVFSSGNGIDLDVTPTDDGPDEDADDDVLVTCQATDVAPYPDLTLTVNGEVMNTSASVTSSSDDLYDVLINVTMSDDFVANSEVACTLTFVNVANATYTVAETYNDSSMTTTEESDEMPTTEASENPSQINSKCCISSSIWIILTALTFICHQRL